MNVTKEINRQSAKHSSLSCEDRPIYIVVPEIDVIMDYYLAK
jgi:hypothetical protein